MSTTITARRDRKSMTLMIPLAVLSVGVVIILAILLAWSGREVDGAAAPGEAPNNEVAVEPTGAGTAPEGVIDQAGAGLSDETDSDMIEGAAGAASSAEGEEMMNESGAAVEDGAAAGEEAADDEGAALEPAADQEQGDLAPAGDEQPATVTQPTATVGTTETPEGEEGAEESSGMDLEEVDDPDTDTEFTPTPSGPEGRDGETILQQ
ncbi:hypothetical protein RM543_17175 [Roseicyclus sp. F158]|uniref:Uncharacterized protein n=1 Tax=Tropicimonas omnivorans TaxID=3075590 RepID=A0ABU3DL24_9RHOB|nr:hypothetical protein [Roseicyclus sp. F158]MDT0684416.1 hypothetical protein [Roseicyclus sp. F158]